MSIGIAGNIYHKFNNYLKIEDFSFNIQKIANYNKIGINLNGNISANIRTILNFKTKNCIFFELTDSPLTFNADILFGLDSIEHYNFNEKVSRDESLKTRMDRVQNFLEGILANKNVLYINLYINCLIVDQSDIPDIKIIKVTDFCTTIVEICNIMYIVEIPAVNLSISL